MEKNKQPIQAEPFQAPNQRSANQQTTKQQVGHSPWWYSPFNLMLCVLVLLAVCAVLLVRLLPEPVAPDPNDYFVNGSDKTATVDKSAGIDSATPWSKEQVKQARSDSQVILAKLLELKKTLEADNVNLWSERGFQQALGLATQGDALYKQQDYPKAIQQYQSALNAMQALQELKPSIVQNQLQQALISLQQGKADLSKQQFETVLQVDASNEQAKQGLQRVSTLNQVLALIESASKHESAYQQTKKTSDLTAAHKQFKKAVALDSQMQTAVQGLVRVEGMVSDKEYKRAMSEGFKALFANRYSKARNAFTRALKIKPNDKMASDAYQQSTASSKTSSRKASLISAQANESNENWSQALADYTKLLQADPNLVDAKLGKLRSQARLKLDKQINEVLDNRLALSNAKQKLQAQAVLADARAIKQKGPKLKQQIEQLQAALKQSEVARSISLISNGQTQVSLLKRGANKKVLGKFTSKKLSLKPGFYVATGVRIGYQDVRVEIKLDGQSSGSQQFVVRCDQAIDQTLIK